MKITRNLFITAVLAAGSSQAAISLEISSIGKTELVGSTSDVIGTGGVANFSTGQVVFGTTNARFQLVEAGTTNRHADLMVTVVSASGTLSNALDGPRTTSGIMVAQTTNSQSLSDSGTLSILTNFASTGTTGVQFRFDFFVPDTNTPKNVPLRVTSFDIDFQQYIKVAASDYTSYAAGSLLNVSTTTGVTTFADNTPPNDTVVRDPATAFAFESSDSSFDLTMGKVGYSNNSNGAATALFIFEFRSPSSITPTINPIPEPTSALMLVLGAVGFLRRNRF